MQIPAKAPLPSCPFCHERVNTLRYYNITVQGEREKKVNKRLYDTRVYSYTSARNLALLALYRSARLAVIDAVNNIYKTLIMGGGRCWGGFEGGSSSSSSDTACHLGAIVKCTIPITI